MHPRINLKLEIAVQSSPRKNPPRCQKIEPSPRRFTPSAAAQRKTRPSRFFSASRFNHRPDPAKTPGFSPKLRTCVFVSEPETIYDLRSTELSKIKSEFSKLIHKQGLRTTEVLKGAKHLQKGCKDLYRLLSKTGQSNREEITEIEKGCEKVHEKSAEFFREVKKGNAFRVQQLLFMNPELIKEVDFTRQTALHWAVKRNQGKMARILLSSGARPRAKDIAGRTPEDIARKYGCTELIKIFAGIDRRSAIFTEIFTKSP